MIVEEEKITRKDNYMIDTKKLEEIFFDCFLTEKELEELDETGEPLFEVIKVEAIVSNFGFHSERIKKHADEIVDFLDELPDEFKSSGGGGWSFLNACMDRHGNQWGGHNHMEQLFALGIAIGKVKFLMPRKMWRSFPGGVPYVLYMDKVK